MFVAYLEHDPPRARIQGQDCWYLEVETETSKEMVSGISEERDTGKSLHGLLKVEYKWVSHLTLPCPSCLVLEWAVRGLHHSMVEWWHTQVRSQYREYKEELH